VVGITALILASQARVPWRHRDLISAERAHAQTADALSLADNGGDPSGEIVDEQLFSAAVGQSLPYRVYLPPGYDANPSVRYPALYMLHGLGGTYLEWSADGLLDTADRLINTGQIAPLIIVMPEGEQAYWVDHADGGPRWGAYVAQDLVAAVDARYRTIADRGRRAIGGMSMGGNGALQLAINYPDVFSVVGAHSFALRRRDTAPPYFGDQTYFDDHDPVYLFKSRPDVARKLTVWLDVGASDPWQPADAEFNQQLSGEGIQHAWHVFSGGHEDAYWSDHAADYLRFYSAALTANPK
jgi:enterochelin esterase-like enzyme